MSFSTRHLVSINEAIFADVVDSSRLAHDQKLLQLLQAAYSADSPLFRDVCYQVDQLGLLPFQTGQDASPEREIKPLLDENEQHEIGESQESQKPVEVPQLTKNERRLSFELMHYIPNPSLAKPAETGISSVSVVTKVTDLGTNGYVPVKQQKNALADKIKRYLGRFQLLNQNRQRRKLKAKEAKSAPQSTSIPPSVVPPSISTARRLSVVGQNLPLYIKSQLEPKEAGVAESAKDVVASQVVESSNEDIYSHASSAPKRKDRIGNLLANLESLYFHHDANSTGETSFGSNTNNESTISDADREYILPNSFTQWNDHDQDGLHIYQSSLEESANNEDDDDDDDEYLFQEN